MARFSKSIHYMNKGVEKTIALYEVGTPGLPAVDENHDYLKVNIDGKECVICCARTFYDSKAKGSDIFVKIHDSIFKMCESYEGIS